MSLGYNRENYSSNSSEGLPQIEVEWLAKRETLFKFQINV
jgi:hypothetical protein